MSGAFRSNRCPDPYAGLAREFRAGTSASHKPGGGSKESRRHWCGVQKVAFQPTEREAKIAAAACPSLSRAEAVKCFRGVPPLARLSRCHRF
jgi:hypothetical protein